MRMWEGEEKSRALQKKGYGGCSPRSTSLKKGSIAAPPPRGGGVDVRRGGQLDGEETSPGGFKE